MAEADVVSVNELFSVIWDSLDQYRPFLLILKIENPVINRAFHPPCDRAAALANCLEHYLNNVCVNWTSAGIWENVAHALGKCGNTKKAEEIRQKLRGNERIAFFPHDEYFGSGENYTGYYSSMQAQQKIDAERDFDYLKSSVTLHYSEAKRKLREFHLDVKEVLNNEEKEASDILMGYKMQGEKIGNECEIRLNELLDRTSHLETLLTKIRDKLEVGNCTAFPAMNQVHDEYSAIEKLLAEARVQFERYQNFVSNQTGDSVAKTEDVIHSLQAIMKLTSVQTTVCTDESGVDDDDAYEVVKHVIS